MHIQTTDDNNKTQLSLHRPKRQFNLEPNMNDSKLSFITTEQQQKPNDATFTNPGGNIR